MEGKMFDVRLIPEFSGAATDMPIVQWVENVELVCELCTMKNVEHIQPLRLRGGALAVYRQLSAEQKADAEQIKQALITTYATDAFNAYDQFVTRQLCPDETVDKFFAELRWLAWLVGGPLPERWLTHAFVSGLLQHIRHLLCASSRMEMMSAEQLLTRTRAVMTDNEDPTELAAASTRWTPSESKVHNDATGVVVPTTWWRTAYRIAKRGRIVGCSRFVMRYVASDAVALDTQHCSAREMPKGRRYQH